MKSQTPKVAIIGSVLTGNKGAAAMLESAVQTVSEKLPNAEFSLLTYIPVEEEQSKNPYKNLEIVKATPLYLALVLNPLALLYKILPPLRSLFKKSKALKVIAEADVLLDQGGITFVDGRTKFLLYNVASILPALLVGTKVVKCSQALGPFKSTPNKFAAKLILPKVTKIFSRGSATHKYLEDFGLKNVEAAADYAFLLDVTKQETKSAEKRIPKEFFKKGKVIGIAPSTVMQKKVVAQGLDYTKILNEFVTKSVKNNFKVILVAHSARKTDKVSTLDKLPIPLLREIRAKHTNDLIICREVFNSLENDVQSKCLFIDDELPSQELRYLIGKCDYFIAARFHAMVSSLAMGVPTLVMGWSHKYKEVLEMFELESWAFDFSKLSSDYLWQRTEELVSSESDVRKKLSKNLPNVKKRSYKQVKYIVELLSK